MVNQVFDKFFVFLIQLHFVLSKTDSSSINDREVVAHVLNVLNSALAVSVKIDLFLIITLHGCKP